MRVKELWASLNAFGKNSTTFVEWSRSHSYAFRGKPVERSSSTSVVLSRYASEGGKKKITQNYTITSHVLHFKG